MSSTGPFTFTFRVVTAVMTWLGGVVEACPPSDSVTTVSVSVLVEPGTADGGAVELVASGDQIHADSEFSCWGLTCPQSSVDPARLNAAVNKVAGACRARGIVGYITVDFVTFIDPLSVSSVFVLSTIHARSVLDNCSNGVSK